MDELAALRQFFGFSAFRAGQQTLINAVLSGRDALGVMPTGGGKSLCYELPGLLLPVIPSVEEFPYAIRVVSEVLSSNGSTSQGSICGSTLPSLASL